MTKKRATEPDDAPCASCGEIRIVMFTMEPGVDGKRWRLCGADWRKFGAGSVAQPGKSHAGIFPVSTATPQPDRRR